MNHHLRFHFKGGVLVRILTLTTVLIVASVAIGVLTSMRVADQLYSEARDEAAEHLDVQLMAQLSAEQAKASVLAVTAANDPAAVEAFAARDRERLAELTVPAWKLLKSEYGMAQYQWHVAPATSFLRVHKPEKFDDDLSSFRHTVVQTNTTGRMQTGVEGGVAGLGIRAVVPVMYDGEQVGSVEFGTSLGDAFVQGLAELLEVDAALYAQADDGSMTALATTFESEEGIDPELLVGSMGGDETVADVEVDGVDHFMLYEPVEDFQGNIVGVIALSRDASSLTAAAADARNSGLTVGVLVLLIGLALGAFVAIRIGRSVTKPVEKISDTLSKVAEGDLTVRAVEEGDQTVQTLARRLNRTLDSLADLLRSIRLSADGVVQSVEQSRAAVARLEEAAGHSAERSERANLHSSEVMEGVEQVVVSMEEMAASIKEIARTAAEASKVGDHAMDRANITNDQIKALGQTMSEVDEVVRLIHSIAEQTNLLALNATIEAARAGEAGRGFAVVASEVKTLADGTAHATGDISEQVEAMQSGSGDAVNAIEEIVGVIAQVNDHQSEIATAVEEQTAVTSEISNALSLASTGMREISISVAGLLEAATATSEASEIAASAAAAADEHSAQMHRLIERFHIDDDIDRRVSVG